MFSGAYSVVIEAKWEAILSAHCWSVKLSSWWFGRVKVISSEQSPGWAPMLFSIPYAFPGWDSFNPSTLFLIYLQLLYTQLRTLKPIYHIWLIFPSLSTLSVFFFPGSSTFVFPRPLFVKSYTLPYFSERKMQNSDKKICWWCFLKLNKAEIGLINCNAGWSLY